MRRRIFACIIILGVILALTWYSDRSMEHFTRSIDTLLAQAETALDADDAATAMQLLARGVELCCDTRTKMTHFWRVEDLTELEASLEASLGYLELDASEEALGELRRAAVQVKSLARLSQRLV